jgi:DNA-binding transcriptional regulator LsrR (DeoR family)
MDFDRARLLGKVARLYYEHDMSQAEISERLRLSRQRVQRLLSHARQEGIVNISIHPIMGTFSELERSLESRFDLPEALVVETSAPDNQNTIARELGAGAAEYLARLVHPKDKVVLSWGNSLLGMVNALASRSRIRMPDLRLIQGLGSLGDPNIAMYGGELVRRAAKALGAKPILFPAPAIAASTAVRDALYADPYVSHTLDLARSADIALVGIGSSHSDSIAVPDLWRFLPPAALPELLARGAVGSINLRYFNGDGCLVPSEINDRVIGLTLDEMKNIARVVGIAGGPAKLRAIHAALKARLINVLVTDHVTATELLLERD